LWVWFDVFIFGISCRDHDLTMIKTGLQIISFNLCETFPFPAVAVGVYSCSASNEASV